MNGTLRQHKTPACAKDRRRESVLALLRVVAKMLRY